jgi:hypothetical protein
MAQWRAYRPAGCAPQTTTIGRERLRLKAARIGIDEGEPGLLLMLDQQQF